MCNGSTTFPKLLDIFLPCPSHIILCSMTSLKGSSLNSMWEIMTIRATQKNSISWPVSIKDKGKFFFKSTVSEGHWKLEKGRREDENQVSKTSSSYLELYTKLNFPSNQNINKNSNADWSVWKLRGKTIKKDS